MAGSVRMPGTRLCGGMPGGVSVPGKSQLIRFSTDDFPDHDKASVWREHFGEAIANMDLATFGEGPFRSKCHIRALPDFVIWGCAITESEVRRTARHVADSDDSLVLAIVTEGRSVVTQASHEALFGQGDALLWTTERTGVYRNLGSVNLVCLKFPRRSLAATVADLDQKLMSVIPASNAALRLLTNYLGILQSDHAPLAPELLAVTMPHIHDLASMALGATQEAKQIASEGGVPAARLHAIKADILANLTDPELDVNSIALRHGISPRYIRLLFDGDQTTFTDFVREQRLRRAYRMLSDAACGHSISVIAFDCGYSSASYFNQAFRRRFGATPKDIRNGARGGLGE